MLHNGIIRLWSAALIALALCAAMPAAPASANPLDAIASFFGIGAAEQAEPAAELDGQKVVDPDTKETWEHWALDSTENVGRIWTDKSVYEGDVQLPGENKPTGSIEDSDFLVMLSALSSTSNLTTTTSKPLDIMLVLDVSGSMADPLSYDYEPTYDVEEYFGPDYFARNEDGTYTQIDRETNWLGLFDHWELNGEEVTPKTSADDNANGHIQFYTRQGAPGSPSKMEALETAANNFIAETAKKNDAINDETKRHRVSVVKFADDTYEYDYGNDVNRQDQNLTQRLAPLTAYTSANVSALTDDIKSINAEGATAADYGMNMVQQEFEDSPRPAGQEAQQVVIFFTDGEPTHGSVFDGTVANTAIQTALELKNDGALVYSIGVFDGANPDNLDGDTNRYMQGLSSNYPKAEGYEQNRLGTRTDDSNADYYKAASDADSLNEIFTDILEQISTLPQSPTEIEQGYEPDKSGYVTFTDKLGDYMKVDEFREIIFAGQTFSNPTKTENADTNTTTYTYTGKVESNPVYPDGDLSTIIVEVAHGTKAAEGDTVTVKIPASMIPLRNFKVATNADGQTTMTVDESYPIRIFFGVSHKAELGDLLGNPDDDLVAYIRNNKLEDGEVAFYTNSWTPGASGDTIANFEPATTNNYYYFTEDTPIYSDEDCNNLATYPLNANDTYYYEREFYRLEGNNAVQDRRVYKFAGNSAVAIQGAVRNDRFGTVTGQPGAAYFTSGAPRLTYIDELKTVKSPNATGTGVDVINPEWSNTESVVLANEINVRLGNNGRYAVELPGSLAIEKSVVVPESFGADAVAKLNEREFTFNISLKNADDSPFNGALKADVVNTIDNKAIEEGVDVTFTNGAATYKLKNGEALYIYGISGGSTYEVTEDSVDGFDTTQNGDTGTIESGVIEHATFTNTYAPAAATLTDGTFFASKVLQGRDLKNEDNFEVRLRAEDDEPLPSGWTWTEGVEGQGYRAKGVKVTTANMDKVTFGEIEYTEPGTYTYFIREFIPDDRLPSVSYTDMRYQVTVTVADANLDGKLDEPKVEMVQTANDDGQPLDNPTPVDDSNAKFVNTYSVDSVKQAPVGVKVLTGKSLNDVSPFQFKVVPSPGAPMPDDLTPDNEGAYTVESTVSGNLAFGLAEIGQADLDKTYTYTVTEVIPDDAENADGVKYSEASDDQKLADTWELDGITYDTTVWTATLSVTKVTEGSEDQIKVSWNYSGKKGDGIASTASRMTFTNVYSADPVTLGDDDVIKGSKTLEGRDFKDAETFGFTLEGADDATKAAMNDGVTIKNLSTQATVYDGGTDFNFGNATFTKAGTYTFKVSETRWNGQDIADKDGLTYDKGVYTVTVKVTDNGNGKLVADTTYVKDGQPQNKADFTNVYKAEGSYGDMTNGGLSVSKTLMGRNMAASDFKFTIKGVDSGTVKGDQAEKLLADSDRSFTSGTRADGNAWIGEKLKGLTFTNADAGKTFAYIVDEDEGKLGGVTYDQSQFRVEIAVIDNLDGTLSCNTTIIRVMNEDGTVNAGNTVDSVAFVNKYSAGDVDVDTDDANVGAQLTKRLTGRAWADGDAFTFNIAPQGNAPAPKNTNGDIQTQVIVSGKPGETADVKFGIGTITFDTEGSYVYNVTEVIPGDATNPNVGDGATLYQNATPEQQAQRGWTKDGITYAMNTAVISIDVTDNGEGQLVAEASVSRGTFTNRYNASVTYADAVDFKLTKTLNGRDMVDGQFIFTVTPKDQASAEKLNLKDLEPVEIPGKGGADGQEVVMTSSADAPLVFSLSDSGKTFTYTFAEKNDGEAGYTYDATAYELAITPKDNGKGGMDIKTVVTITRDDASTEKEFNATAGNKPEVKLPFVNTYEAGSVGVDTSALFSKTVQGRDWLESDAFSFTLKADDPSYPMPKDDEGNVVSSVAVTSKDAKKNEKVSFGFGNILFTDADMAGATSKTFTYSVTEDPYTISGMKPQDAKQIAKLTIKVTDDGKGQLLVTTDPVSNGNFVNVYSSGSVNVDDPAVSGGIVIQKTMTGRAIGKGDFTFTMTPTTPDAVAKFGEKPKSYSTFGAPLGEGQFANQTTELIDVKTDLEFGLEDVGKDFSFTVAEVDGNKPGYDYDLTTHALDFVVTDNTSGTLTVTVKLDGDVVATWSDDVATRAANDVVTIPFSNSYAKDALATANIVGTKTLTGRPMAEGEFTFILSNGGKQVATAKNAADGTISFPQLSYDMATLNSDADAGLATRSERDGVTDYIYTYDVTEDTSSLPEGVTAVTPGAQSVKVVVTDDGAGNLSSAVTYPDAGLVFQNAYGAGEAGTAELQLGGTKELKVESGDNAPDITGKFTFTLSPVTEGAPMPDEATAINDASGSYAFGKIAFDMSIFGEPATTDEAAEAATSPVRTKTFEYKVTESGTVPGVVNDAKPERHVFIIVTDNGDGSITAKLDTQKSDSLAFVNTYKVGETTSTLTGDGGFTVTKSLTGRPTPLAEGEFTFVLRDADGNEVARGVNDANGKVQIAGVKFSSVGTQTFTLEELDNAEDSIECMTDPYKVTASATDNGDGTLKVTWTVEGFDKPGDLAFENVYTPKPTSIILKAAKVLTGRDLKEGEFEFVLSENGKKIDTAKNDALGGVTFDAITYTEPGVHEYTVTEVAGDVENVTYDDTVFTITVTVTDDGSGKLSWTHEFGETGEPVFKNTYEEPKAPEPEPEPKPEPKPEPEDKDKLPGTGDDSMLPVIGVATAGVAAAAVGVYLAKRKDDGGRA